VLHLADDGLAAEVGELDAVGRDNGEIAVGEEEEVAGVVEDGGDVGGDEVFVFAQSDYCGRPIACGNNFVWLFDCYDGDCEHSAQFAHGSADRFFQTWTVAVAGLQKVFFDQVGDYLGIGFGLKLVAFLDELLL
jgi:hypothetical protein